MSLSIFTDIARKVGVTPRTVQRILTHELKDTRPSILARAERIRALGARMGYRPNAAAKATRTGRFNNIALIMSGDKWSGNLPETTLKGLMSALTEIDHHLVVARLPESDDLRLAPRILREWCADGLLVLYTSAIPPRFIELIERFTAPTIWLNVKRGSNCLYPDDRQAGHLATSQLLALGHRRIAYLDGGYRLAQQGGRLHYSRDERMDGYRQAMIDAGLAPEVLLPPGPEEPGGLERLLQLMRGEGRPSALVCYGGEEELLCRLALEQGLRLPRDLAVVAISPQLQPGPHPARVELPDYQLGREAVEMLRQRIDSPDSQIPARAMPCTFIPGWTCGPPG